jgi:hypothetical protein
MNAEEQAEAVSGIMLQDSCQRKIASIFDAIHIIQTIIP